MKFDGSFRRVITPAQVHRIIKKMKKLIYGWISYKEYVYSSINEKKNVCTFSFLTSSSCSCTEIANVAFE